MKKANPHGNVIETLDLNELCRFCDVESHWIIELVDLGVLEPQDIGAKEWRFQGVNIVRAKKARRLNRDLGINAAGVAMVIELLEERDQLVRRLAHHESR